VKIAEGDAIVVRSKGQGVDGMGQREENEGSG
jgi:hypothetical protein